MSSRDPKIPRRITELGIEKLCRGCDEWWPEDDEFWHRHSVSFYQSTCKACRSESDRRRRR